MTEPAIATELPSDRALVERWQSGDHRAASLLVARHGPALARFAAGLGEWEAVEELVQDAFVRAFDSIDGFRNEATLRTWLFTILRRLVLDRRRAARRRREEVDVDDVTLAASGGPLEALVASETERRVHAVVQRLPRLQREVFALRVSEGLSYKEIAQVLDTTEGAARVHYHHATRAVKEALDD
jgi:RNA polymerase sigma-70 factor (ECF subfamily)